MLIRALIIAALGVLSLRLPDPLRQFTGLTLASVFVLSLLPGWIKHHVRKMGTYHHEVSHGLVSLLTGGEFHNFYLHPIVGGVRGSSGERTKLIVTAGYIGTVLFGAVYLAKSAQSDAMIVALYIVALLYALATIKAGDLQTASVGIAIGAFVGLATHVAPGALFTRMVLNMIGVVLIFEGIRSLLDFHVAASTAAGASSRC